MKTINKSLLITTGIALGLLACGEPELPTPNTFSNGATYKANFSFANATANGPSLDFYVNGIKLGTAAPSIGSTLFTTIQIPTPGGAGTVTANAAIRSKATSGKIGGALGASDLIYRAAASGAINPFAAVNNGTYTVIAIDDTARVIPPRLSRRISPTLAVVDQTYWNPNTGTFISASRRDSLNPANCPACVDQTVPTTIEYGNIVTIGLVPLGLTDPGGIRYYVTTDAPLFFTAATLPTNAGIRYVNAISNANNVTVGANANGTFGGPPVYARLNGGVPITLHSTATAPPNASTAFVASVAGGFTPTVGSRTAGAVAFNSQAIAVAGAPNAYTLELATDAGFTNIVYTSPVSFAPGKNYTIFVRGAFTSLLGIQPGISHGIITH